MTEPPSLSSGSAFCTVNTTPLKSDAELIVQVLLGDFADSRDFQHRGVGEDHVDASSAVGDRGVEPVEVFGLAHVTLDAGGLIAEFLDRRVEFGLPAAGDEDVCAFLHESFAVASPIPVVPPVMTAVLPVEKCHGRAFL